MTIETTLSVPNSKPFLTEYQEWSSTTAIYPDERAYEYLVSGLGSEVGEVLGVFKKYLRGDMTKKDFEHRMLSEISDVDWYLAQLCTRLGIDRSEPMRYNMAKLEARKAANKLKGDGEER